MAERRMFAKTIIDSDAFLEMPLSAQALYFHLGMRADDEGFLNNAKKIQRMINASDDDAKLLVAKKFIIPFESGIIVIKHWKIHNYIRNDRIQDTAYQDEKSLLSVKENGSYTMTDKCQSSDGQVAAQVRIGEDSIGKDRIGEGNDGGTPPSRKSKQINLDHIADSGLRTAISNWVESRKAGKSPVTEKALELGLSKLEELYPGDVQKQVKCVNETVLNGWKGFFPLKVQHNRDKPVTINPAERLAELNAKRGVM